MQPQERGKQTRQERKYHKLTEAENKPNKMVGNVCMYSTRLKWFGSGFKHLNLTFTLCPQKCTVLLVQMPRP